MGDSTPDVGEWIEFDLYRVIRLCHPRRKRIVLLGKMIPATVDTKSTRNICLLTTVRALFVLSCFAERADCGLRWKFFATRITGTFKSLSPTHPDDCNEMMKVIIFWFYRQRIPPRFHWQCPQGTWLP
ncbi:MAG: hypothetical protein ACI8ZB_002236 [Desulforhopalus sp.]|jgi:hypothetical protein